MFDVKDYLKYYGDYTFHDEPFNEVDNLVFSLLMYIDFNGIIPAVGKGSITLGEASRFYWNKYSKYDTDMNILPARKAAYVLRMLQDCRRYRNVVVSNYRYVTGKEEQFGAACFRLGKMLYVAFEGTDGLLSGWKEDFKLAYIFPTPSQKRAIDYLNEVVKFNDRCVYVGGHSKGGNLAVVASTFCKSKVKRRIKAVFNNDGPGLRKTEFNSANYRQMKDKIHTFIPEHSIVGLLLSHDDNYTVISSVSKGILEHEASSWCCFGGHFVNCSLSKSSQRFDDIINRHIDNYDYEKMEKFTNVIFDVFKKAEISDLREIKSSTLRSVGRIIASTKDIDPEVREMLFELIKAFIA